MDEKIPKSSILINKDLLSLLVDFIQTFDQTKNKKSKFQIINSFIQGSQIIIYRSGIIVYEEKFNLIVILEEFFINNYQEVPQDLKKSKGHVELISIKESKTQEKSTLSHWLSNLQIEKIMIQLKNLNFDVKTDHSSKIQHRICDTEKNCLVINSNNIVTTNSSKVFYPFIQNIIVKFPVDSEFDLSLGIESIGLFSQIGPIIITIVGITPDQSVKLQSKGVKHAELGRNLKIEKYQSLIFQTLQVKKTIQINPQEVNQDKSDKLLTKLLFNTLCRIKENLQSFNNIIIHLDKKLEFISSDLTQIFPGIHLKYSNKSMSSATASILNRIELDKWIDSMSGRYSLKMIKSNLIEINNLSDREKLIKLKYVKNKKKNENKKL